MKTRGGVTKQTLVTKPPPPWSPGDPREDNMHTRERERESHTAVLVGHNPTEG